MGHSRPSPRRESSRWRGHGALLCAALLAATPAGAPRGIRNPLLASGPDPWIVRAGAVYYHMHSTGDGLEIWKTRDLGDLANAEHRVVWRPSPPAANGQAIWAPELHRIGGHWYIYYSAAASGHDDDAHRGIFVLENTASDPLAGRWIDRGKLLTAHPGIDGTTFAYRGRRYFVYSPYVGADSALAMVAMADPVTLTGAETIIARPEHDWERQGGRQILEGPAFVEGPRGDLFLSFSGSACWSDCYAIGLLRAAPGADPLKAASWHEHRDPVLATTPDKGIFAPGHNSFFTTPGGATWTTYHANPRAGMGCGAARAVRIARVRWDGAGQPRFDPSAE